VIAKSRRRSRRRAYSLSWRGSILRLVARWRGLTVRKLNELELALRDNAPLLDLDESQQALLDAVIAQERQHEQEPERSELELELQLEPPE
jgi:hypothetical protein